MNIYQINLPPFNGIKNKTFGAGVTKKKCLIRTMNNVILIVFWK